MDIYKFDFTDAFILWLSGAAEMKNKKEIIWHSNDVGFLPIATKDITIEFPTNTPNYAIIRKYWLNGNLEKEVEYKNGLVDGVYKGWYKNGIIDHITEYKCGSLHGKAYGFREDGSKWEVLWKNGNRI